MLIILGPWHFPINFRVSLSILAKKKKTTGRLCTLNYRTIIEDCSGPQKIAYSVTQFISVQSLSRVQLFVTPWTTARQASLSITNSQSLLKLVSIMSVKPSNYLIPCHSATMAHECKMVLDSGMHWYQVKVKVIEWLLLGRWGHSMPSFSFHKFLF